MVKAWQDYFVEWWIVIARPILFFTGLKEESWQEKGLTFFMYSTWLLALVASLAIFLIQFVPIGSTLVAGIAGWKFVIILPVLLTLAFAFFMITFLIVGGLLVLGFGAAFLALAYVLHYMYGLLGGRGHLNRMAQDLLYSSAVLLFLCLPALFGVMTRYGALELSLFKVGFNIVFVFLSVYVYGLWAVAGRKVYGVARWRAFLGALAPLALLLIFLFIFDKIAFVKLQTWIAPLK